MTAYFRNSLARQNNHLPTDLTYDYVASRVKGLTVKSLTDRLRILSSGRVKSYEFHVGNAHANPARETRNRRGSNEVAAPGGINRALARRRRRRQRTASRGNGLRANQQTNRQGIQQGVGGARRSRATYPRS